MTNKKSILTQAAQNSTSGELFTAKTAFHLGCYSLTSASYVPQRNIGQKLQIIIENHNNGGNT